MNKIVWVFLFSAFQANAQIDTGTAEVRFQVDTIYDQNASRPCETCLEQYWQYAENGEILQAINLLRGAICAYQCGDTSKLNFFLEKAADADWGECLAIWNAAKVYPHQLPEFAAVRGTTFEIKVLAAAKTAAIERGIHFGLYRELDVMQREDQRQRMIFDSVTKKYAPGSPEYKTAQQELKETDALRMGRIEQIIEQYGYPGKTLVGRYSDVAWLIIQHAPLDKQEHYFPILTEATEKLELDKANWAMLVDRIRLQKNLPQLYGSQVIRDPRTGLRSFHPIEDEANVNIRRTEVGLIPLEDYAKSFGFEWHPPK